MRTSDDKQKTDGTTTSSSSSSSKSCVVENENNNNNNDNNLLNNNETVMVNNCVNIDLNANISAQTDGAKDTLILVNNEIKEQATLPSNNQVVFDSIKCDETMPLLDDGLKDDEINAKSIDVDDNTLDENDKEIDDDDAFASSSKYSDVSFNRCDMLQPCSTSTSSLNSHVAAHNQYTPSRDNNRSHRRAVRKNFSLWIGVTSCVWACLVWLMKNYAN
jgi:hypothetical protein